MRSKGDNRTLLAANALGVITVLGLCSETPHANQHPRTPPHPFLLPGLYTPGRAPLTQSKFGQYDQEYPAQVIYYFRV